MSVTAIYVFSTTAFTVGMPSTIEQLAKNPAGGYSVVSKGVAPGAPFSLERGVYRLRSGATITAASGFAAAAMPATGGTVNPAFHIIALSDTKTRWPDPVTASASATLNIPLADLKPFLADASAQTVLAPARSING